MYWRVQKISVEQLAKAYGVYLVCIASLLFNFVLLAKMPSLHKLTSQQRTDYESFAKEVTRHLCDSGFMTYTNSMNRLAFAKSKPELAPSVIKALTPDVIPPTPDHMKAIDKRLHETKSVSQVSIDDVKIEEADANHMVPVEVSGRVVRSSAGEVTGPDEFRFRFLIGQAKKGEDEWTLVVDLRDISGQATPAAPTQ